MISYTEGTLLEALAAEALIPEFDRKKTLADYQAKLGNRKHLILVAKDEGQCIGFKVGYELSADVFYSWLGGVTPTYRNRGVAKRLRDIQEQWARENGYQTIQVKSKNRFPSMLQMLVAGGYKIRGYEDQGNIEENKIIFSKELA